MRILVTGGIGNVGRAVVARLHAGGHVVRVVGRRASLRVEGAEYRQCDITDFPSILREAKGMEAIVHLAAMGNPSMAAPHTVFEINCEGTFNVYEAAARAGIRRVVTASSINALGFGFGVRDFRVDYLPIDEEHPTSPTDAYSFSKNIAEEIAEYHWRREGISGVCLRLPAVVPAGSYDEKSVREVAALCRAEAEELLALPKPERGKRLDAFLARLAEARRERLFENPPKGWQGVFPDSPLMGMRSDFWTSLDERDGAQAVEKGLLAGYEGSHALFVVDSHNRTGVPSRRLAECFYPGVTAWKQPVEGTESLVSIDKARKILGFEPEYSAARFL